MHRTLDENAVRIIVKPGTQQVISDMERNRVDRAVPETGIWFSRGRGYEVPRMFVRLSWLLSLLWLLQSHAAQACGEWSLEDDERGHTIRFYIRSTFLDPATRAPGEAPKNRILLIEGMSAEQLHSEAGGRTQFAVVNDQLQLFGRKVGELRGDELTIGRVSYQISVAKSPLASADGRNREDRWLVDIRRGPQRIAHGVAMAMCIGGLEAPEDSKQELEIRRRSIFYLGWRELVSRKPATQNRSAIEHTQPLAGSENAADLILTVTPEPKGAVGYGTVFLCQIRQVVKGEAGLRSPTIALTVLAGDKRNEEFFASRKASDWVEVGFKKNREAEPYRMMPITGFVDERRTSWRLIYARPAASADPSPNPAGQAPR